MKIDSKIIGKKTLLVPYSKLHVPKYHKWMQNNELLEKTASERLTLEEEYSMQQKWLNDEDKCTFIILSKDIWEKTGCEVESMVGDVNLFFKNAPDRTEAEIEVMIAEPYYRRCGLGKESVLAMMLYGYEKLGVKTLVAIIGNNNKESLALFSKLGFIKVNETAVFNESTYELKVTSDFSQQQNISFIFQSIIKESVHPS